MYIPASFHEQRHPNLYALMRAYPFATIITQVDGRPFATHLPFLLDTGRGEKGVLRAHFARSNPQWRGFADEQEALVIFQGPHAYISPSWYDTQPAVPTWNYAVVHAYGVPRCVDDAALREILVATVETFDGSAPLPIPDAYFENMARGVVGFEMALSNIEGKFKLSQNRSDVDRERVIRALNGSPSELDRAVAKSMEISLIDGTLSQAESISN